MWAERRASLADSPAGRPSAGGKTLAFRRDDAVPASTVAGARRVGLTRHPGMTAACGADIAWRNILGQSRSIVTAPAQRRRSSPPAKASACTPRCRRCCIRWPGGRWSRTSSTPRARLSPRAIAVVVGHGADAVREALAAPDLAFVAAGPAARHRRRGARRAAALPADGVTLVTIGDVPLVPASALAALVEHARRGDLGAADGAGGRSRRARPHRARCRRRACARSSRSATRQRDAARDRRDQHRRHGRADRAACSAGSRS